jgi:hemerythrin-like domain-containing protein
MVLAASGCGAGSEAVQHAPAGERASAAFREEHAQLLAHLDEAEANAMALLEASEGERDERIHAIVHFFRHQLLPHAQAEEHVLYAVADRRVPTQAPHRWTHSLRYEHTVVHAAIEEMHAFMESSDRSPEALARFSARAIATIGLVRGHFGAEEHVVLDALDRTMSREEFRREVIEPTQRYVAAHGGAAHEH